MAGQVAATLQKTGTQMTRAHLPGILAMAAIVLASNILVQFLFGQWLTWGAFTYPFAFLVTDVMNRVYGPNQARRVVFVGFFTGVICSAICTQIVGEFGPRVTWRIALGSGVAFLVAQTLDISIFDKLRNGAWWKAPLASTLIGSTLDTALFFFIAFSSTLTFLEPVNDVAWANEMIPMLGSGPVAPLWISLAMADWSVKLCIALIALVPFRIVVGKMMARVA